MDIFLRVNWQTENLLNIRKYNFTVKLNAISKYK
jgi:hypothetical protein